MEKEEDVDVKKSETEDSSGGLRRGSRERTQTEFYKPEDFRVLSYLSTTKEKPLLLGDLDGSNLTAYSDANYAPSVIANLCCYGSMSKSAFRAIGGLVLRYSTFLPSPYGCPCVPSPV
ncbi:hypothetical protein TYRP_022912 [Tyrophagus putrescentiae]|nr:hypothetical protein TYRP_022912 [Tyrophagus putrescentiae]